MRLVPLAYPLRSIMVRWTNSLFACVGIACTIGVFVAIASLNSGLEKVYGEVGRDDLIVYLRPGATSEGESSFKKELAQILMKERPEIAKDANGRPLAAAEGYLGLLLERSGGGTTNVPIRGIEEMTRAIQGDAFRITEGRMLTFGTDEIIVGEPVSTRMKNCRIGDTLVLNLTPFKVVGTFHHDGAYGSEIWTDADRMTEALERPGRQRVIAKTAPGFDIAGIAKELEGDKRIPAKVATEREYLESQKSILGTAIQFLARFVAAVMAVGAVLGATTTMMSSVSSRTREVGILLSTGFSRMAIFSSFVFEAVLIAAVGGVIGALAMLPFNGAQTSTTNMQTFTEVAFSFDVTPMLLLTAFLLALLLGVIGGALPAFRASQLAPTTALRRR